MSSVPPSSSLCARCGATVTSPFCGQCGLSAGAPDRSRRAVVVGAVGVAAAAGLGTWALVHGQGAAARRTSALGHGAGAWESEWLAGVAGLKQATEQQKSTSKPLLVYFYATWCGYCRRLESTVLSTDEGRSALHDVIKVRINAEETRESQQLAGELGVRGYPTLMLVTPQGDLRRIRTPQSIDELRHIFG